MVDYDKAARGKLAAIEAGWDVEEIAQFLEALDGFIVGIEEGVFDGPEIKRIVTACFTRREAVLKGRPTLQRAALATPTMVGPMLGEGGYTVKPVYTNVRSIEYAGKRYSKDDLVGKVFNTGTGNCSWYYANCVLKILSVGTAYMLCEFQNDPQELYPNSTELKKNHVSKGSQIKWPPSRSPHLFDTN